MYKCTYMGTKLICNDAAMLGSPAVSVGQWYDTEQYKQQSAATVVPPLPRPSYLSHRQWCSSGECHIETIGVVSGYVSK